jgi:uncharacterized protein
MRRLTLLLIPMALILTGCGPNKKPANSNTSTQRAQDEATHIADSHMLAGQFELAAQSYQHSADTANGHRKAKLLLLTAYAWLKAQNDVKARNTLANVSSFSLPLALANEKNLIDAELALHNHQADLVLNPLLMQPFGASTDIALRIRRHTLRAQAYQMNGNLLEQAHELSDLDLLLQNDAKLANQRALLNTLSSLTDTALRFLQPEPSNPLAGWMELALIKKGLPFDPSNFSQLISEWRLQFPNHPADSQLLTDITDKIAIISKPIGQLALLLPQEGPYAGAAKAFQDGFLAARYTFPGSTPTVKVYNTAAFTETTALYQQAIAEGANFVVGPLQKKNVRSLALLPALETPVLALNYANDIARKDNFYQFSLSPEDEANAAAEKAWADGHTQALVLTPKNNLGNRISSAFQSRWLALGGTILEAQSYNTADRDFSIPIKALLNIDESEQRLKTLKKRFGGKIEFEPRRRSDAQFIFIAAKPIHARIIRPQLQFYRATELPVIATSHSYSGTASPIQDRDLNGLYFCDIPWILTEDTEALLSRDKFLEYWPNISERYLRLYAMGIDAYAMLAQLPWLADNPNQTYSGKTGLLSLDDKMQIHRKLVWAQFTEGSPKLIENTQALSNADTRPSHSIVQPIPLK